MRNWEETEAQSSPSTPTGKPYQKFVRSGDNSLNPSKHPVQLSSKFYNEDC
ncbi:hypothetical protein CROQUDRAFT_97448 [Cronartium quercuum f. sp. fusiforme G11]|uniref:Uncharacterized protein n=1 Tax=Cronartium quercuum f. sp. fusiforme G11 TaxID=708437 RepID=A0A9P6NAR7_9BASI|nr:hypothetical protein CROQUDRAFT_97448 [Cronartium quercuum f. sp. fusiforme G11]